MITVEELYAIREEMQPKVAIRRGSAAIRVVVSAGARPVLNAFVESIENEGLTAKAVALQSADVESIDETPTAVVYENGAKVVTYRGLTPDAACEIVRTHLAGGQIVSAYVAGNN